MHEQSIGQMQELYFDGALVIPICKHNNLDLYPHYRSYVASMSGFTGSAGTFIIANSKALFFANGIYRLQAERELQGFDEIIAGSHNLPIEFLLSKQIHKIYYDPKWWTAALFDSYIAHLAHVQWVPINIDPREEVSNIRIEEIHDFPMEFAGASSEEKIKKVTEHMRSDYMLISAADSIAWLLNIRGHSVDNYPLFFGDAIIDKNGHTTLFTDAKYSGNSAISIRTHNDIVGFLESVVAQTFEYDPKFISLSLRDAMQKCKNARPVSDPCQRLKATKNDVEIEGFTNAHIRDAVALTNFMYWLNSANGINEYDCACKLNELRAAQPLFQFNSFDPIVGFNENAAVIHYHPISGQSADIRGDGVLLVDSGGHYMDGTTDVTRTMAVGEPSAKQRSLYTAVLKGHLALQRIIFPVGTTYRSIESLARQYLWQQKQDYSHGTGHGVGHYSAVHEWPGTSSNVVIEVGTVFTIEPGVYIDAEFGIRIENVVKTIDKGNGFLGFEPLTLVPYDRHMIDVTLLTNDEVDQIADYYEHIAHKIVPILEPEVREWMMRICQPPFNPLTSPSYGN